MKKLPKLSEYVKNRFKNSKNGEDMLADILNFTLFILKPLNLSHFVPAKLVDGVWVVLEESECYGKKYTEDISVEELVLHEEYVQALENCIFKDFEVSERYGNKTIKHKNSDFTVLWLTPIIGWKLSLGLSDIESILHYNLEITDNIAEKFKI